MGGQFLQIVSNTSLSLFLWRLWRDKPLGAVGALVCIIFIFTGLFADWIAPFDYNEMNPQDRLQGPSFAYFFGTDQIGRDVFSRIVYGARTSMVIGFSVALLSILISIFLGVLSGYFGGKLDMVLQRLVDAWMSFPDLVVVIVAVSVLGPGKIQIILMLKRLEK